MNEIKIYKSCSVLGAEKRNIYTANNPASDIYDIITVRVPDEVELILNHWGEILVEFEDSEHTYLLNDVLSGNEYPHFSYINREETLKRIRLEVVDVKEF